MGYATRPGAGVTSLGGNQARTNKQFQANLGGCRRRDLLMSVRDLACSQSPSNMRSAITRNTCSRSTRAKLAHNLGAAWRRFQIADRVQARGPGFEGCTKLTPYCLLWSDCPRHKRRADLGAAVRIRASAAIQSAKAHINQLLMRNFAASAGGSRG